MAWQIKKNNAGRPITSPSRLRQLVADFYAGHVEESEADGYPFLQQLLVHNEAEIGATFGVSQEGDEAVYRFGWYSEDGRFVRVGPHGLFRDKDRTIASLLANLHWIVGGEDFNRFFSYADEVKDRRALPDEFWGISWAWSRLQDPGCFTDKVPKKPN
jgi:hypothetical protein